MDQRNMIRDLRSAIDQVCDCITNRYERTLGGRSVSRIRERILDAVVGKTDEKCPSSMLRHSKLSCIENCEANAVSNLAESLDDVVAVPSLVFGCDGADVFNDHCLRFEGV